MLVYVDDVVITGNDDKFVGNLVQNLSMEFALKDLSKLHYFRG